MISSAWQEVLKQEKLIYKIRNNDTRERQRQFRMWIQEPRPTIILKKFSEVFREPLYGFSWVHPYSNQENHQIQEIHLISLSIACSLKRMWNYDPPIRHIIAYEQHVLDTAATARSVLDHLNNEFNARISPSIFRRSPAISINNQYIHERRRETETMTTFETLCGIKEEQLEIPPIEEQLQLPPIEEELELPPIEEQLEMPPLE